jgi:hypothetical protein
MCAHVVPKHFSDTRCRYVKMFFLILVLPKNSLFTFCEGIKHDSESNVCVLVSVVVCVNGEPLAS